MYAAYSTLNLSITCLIAYTDSFRFRMTKQYEPARDVWEFEQYLASKPDVWINQARNLRYSAEALCLHHDEALQRVSQENWATRIPLFWGAGVTRMLMGFSLENLIKAILLQNPDKLKTVFGREGNLSWGKDGHDLLTV